MKLKTLKDFEGTDYDEEDIRNEVTKWIKHWTCYPDTRDRIEAFKHFFNITEEDLTESEGGKKDGKNKI